MAAIQIRPSTSWRHLPNFGVTNGSLSVVMLFSVFSKQASVKRIHPDASQKGEGCDRRLAICCGHMAYVLVHIAVYKRRALNVPYKITSYIQLVNVMGACLTGAAW